MIIIIALGTITTTRTIIAVLLAAEPFGLPRVRPALE